MMRIINVLLIGVFFGVFAQSVQAQSVEVPSVPVQAQPVQVQSVYVQPVQPVQKVIIRELQVIPCLPNPNSGRIYCLQTGSFAMQEAAVAMAHQLSLAGFEPILELYGMYYRVLVPNIPAIEVYPTVQMLGLLGIGQIWVRG